MLSGGKGPGTLSIHTDLVVTKIGGRNVTGKGHTAYSSDQANVASYIVNSGQNTGC